MHGQAARWLVAGLAIVRLGAFGRGDIRRLARCEMARAGQEIGLAADGDPGGAPAARPATWTGLPPSPQALCRCALTRVTSIVWSVRSPAPLVAKALGIGPKSPAWRQGAIGRPAAFHLPKGSGRSRQAAPVRTRRCSEAPGGCRWGGRTGAASPRMASSMRSPPDAGAPFPLLDRAVAPAAPPCQHGPGRGLIGRQAGCGSRGPRLRRGRCRPAGRLWLRGRGPARGGRRRARPGSVGGGPGP